MSDPELIVKSKQRVADHGEVYTPAWLVNDMLSLVQQESERIDSRVLEPACGSGNFLVPILQRKLNTVDIRYGQNQFEKEHFSLLALMSIYGIELLEDNTRECRENLISVARAYHGDTISDTWYEAAGKVLATNIVRGDALTMTSIPEEKPLLLPEWGYLGKGKFQRRDFRFDTLTQRSNYFRNTDDSFESTIFNNTSEESIFTPSKIYPIMTIRDIARV